MILLSGIRPVACVLAPVIAVLLAHPAVAQTTYYVDGASLNASDSNPGTSPSLPWMTIHKATISAQSGDIVKIEKAVYSKGTNGETFPLVISDSTSGSSATRRARRTGP